MILKKKGLTSKKKNLPPSDIIEEKDFKDDELAMCKKVFSKTKSIKTLVFDEPVTEDEYENDLNPDEL